LPLSISLPSWQMLSSLHSLPAACEELWRDLACGAD
jgi:hypothetical protein